MNDCSRQNPAYRPSLFYAFLLCRLIRLVSLNLRSYLPISVSGESHSYARGSYLSATLTTQNISLKQTALIAKNLKNDVSQSQNSWQCYFISISKDWNWLIGIGLLNK